MFQAVEGMHMISYARMYDGKNPDSIRQLFLSRGADPDGILIDDSWEGKKESSAYLEAKELAADYGELTIDSLDSLGKTSREISKELIWFSDRKVNLRIIDLPSSLQPGVFSTDILKDIYAQLAEAERERVRKAQTAGIRKAQADQKKLGRTRIPIPDNWEENYTKWEQGEITINQFMNETGLKRGTLYNLIKATKEEKQAKAVPADA